MISARKIKLRHRTHTFISKKQVFEFMGDPNFQWGPGRSGLRYGDIRSHQKRPHVRRDGHGKMELNDVPIDTIHAWRKNIKKLEAADRVTIRNELRMQKRARDFAQRFKRWYGKQQVKAMKNCSTI